MFDVVQKLRKGDELCWGHSFLAQVYQSKSFLSIKREYNLAEGLKIFPDRNLASGWLSSGEWFTNKDQLVIDLHNELDSGFIFGLLDPMFSYVRHGSFG